MSAATYSVENMGDDPEAECWQRDADLHARVLSDMIAVPEKYDDIPNGCLLILVPDDDPNQREWAIRQGATAVRDGASVYLRRVDTSHLPDVPAPLAGESVGTRRIEYGPGGELRRVTVLDADRTWHEVAPTAEDASGLPPTIS